ncbi:MAG TPA: hypothetical protein P5568_13740 [Acidobacteriota bacterium]|mgnify:CR=1 FL=1|nr:hypothetical protein [Acidobacteriota bacterium]
MTEDKKVSGPQARLMDIKEEMARLKHRAEESFRQMLTALAEVRQQSVASRELLRRIEDLRAEALYLQLLHDLPEDQFDRPQIPWDEAEHLWREIESQWQPAAPGRVWLERIREVEQRKISAPILAEDERAELRSLLEEIVCPICVSYSLDGTCRQEAFEECPIEMFLDRLVRMVAEMGHRPWMEEYFERMYRDVCPHCHGRDSTGFCGPRENGDCSLYTYLPTVVRTIEDFLRQRQSA